MSATPLEFGPYIQEVIDAGCITAEQAWVFEWDLIARSDKPWGLRAYNVSQQIGLYYLDVEGVMAS